MVPLFRMVTFSLVLVIGASSSSLLAAPCVPGQTTQQFVISKPPACSAAWCHACADQVSMVTAEEAAVITVLSARAIHRSVERGEVHFAETAEGFLLICLESLSTTDPRRRLP